MQKIIYFIGCLCCSVVLQAQTPMGVMTESTDLEQNGCDGSITLTIEGDRQDHKIVKIN